jgi:hypothetical protein
MMIKYHDGHKNRNSSSHLIETIQTNKTKQNKHIMFNMKYNTEAYPTSSRTEAAMATSISVPWNQRNQGDSELINSVQSRETEEQAKFNVTWANVFVVPEKAMAGLIPQCEHL